VIAYYSILKPREARELDAIRYFIVYKHRTIRNTKTPSFPFRSESMEDETFFEI